MWDAGFDDKLYELGRPSAAWTRVQVDKEGVLKLFPRPTAKAKQEYDCRTWLTGLMKQSPGEKTGTRQGLFKEAGDKFSGIAKWQFDRAWEWAVHDSGAHEWAKAGRPKKKI